MRHEGANQRAGGGGGAPTRPAGTLTDYKSAAADARAQLHATGKARGGAHWRAQPAAQQPIFVQTQLSPLVILPSNDARGPSLPAITQPRLCCAVLSDVLQ